MVVTNDIKIISDFRDNNGVPLSPSDQVEVILDPAPRIEDTSSKQVKSSEPGFTKKRNRFTDNTAKHYTRPDGSSGLTAVYDSVPGAWYIEVQFTVITNSKIQITGLTKQDTIMPSGRRIYVTTSGTATSVTYTPGEMTINYDTKRFNEIYTITGAILSEPPLYSFETLLAKKSKLKQIMSYGGNCYLQYRRENMNSLIEGNIKRLTFIDNGGAVDEFEYIIEFVCGVERR